MKEGWKEIDFKKAIVKVKNTKKLKSSDYKENGLFPIVSQDATLISGYWDTQEDLFTVTKPIVIFGDHTRVVKYVDFDFVIGADGVKILQPIEELDSRFLYYFVKKCDIKNLGYARHYRYLTEKKVPLPPLSEQTRIVSLLDDAFGKLERSREKALKLLDDAKELFQSVLKKEMTPKEGWEVKKFSELFKLKSGDALSAKNIIKGDYPVIGGNGVAGYHNSYNKDGNHVIIGRVGALCGNVHNIIGKFWLTDNAFEVICEKKNFINPYLTIMLRYCNLNKYARQAAQPVISNSSLKDIIINIPPINEQLKISCRIRLLIFKLIKIEEKTNKYLADLDELKQSLLKKAFEGKI